jgi:hypothetical protein
MQPGVRKIFPHDMDSRQCEQDVPDGFQPDNENILGRAHFSLNLSGLLGKSEFIRRMKDAKKSRQAEAQMTMMRRYIDA